MEKLSNRTFSVSQNSYVDFIQDILEKNVQPWTLIVENCNKSAHWASAWRSSSQVGSMSLEFNLEHFVLQNNSIDTSDIDGSILLGSVSVNRIIILNG